MKRGPRKTCFAGNKTKRSNAKRFFDSFLSGTKVPLLLFFKGSVLLLLRIAGRLHGDLDAVDLNAAGGGDQPSPRKAEKKVGRNQPCPCGSGKKYKNCCGKREG